MGASTIRIAWRNLWRNWRRTLLALMAIGIGQWALVAMQGLINGYVDNIQATVTGPLLGHAQIHAQDYRDKRAMDLTIAQAAELTESLRAEPDIAEVAPRIFGAALVAPEQDAYLATVVGLDTQLERRRTGILDGVPGELGPREVYIGARLAARSEASVGMEIALLGTAIDGSMANDLYTIRGIIDSPVELVNQSGVVMRLEDAQTFFVMPDQVHELVLRADTLESAEAMTEHLRDDPRLGELEIASWRELSPELVMVIDSVSWSSLIILALVLIAALAGIVNTLMMATYERTPEFGMLLALGTRPRRIIGMILTEAGLLGLCGAAFGTAIGWLTVTAFSERGIDVQAWGGADVTELAYGGVRIGFDIYPRLTAGDPWLGIISILLVALVAAAWPAIAAGRLEPVEAMHG